MKLFLQLYYLTIKLNARLAKINPAKKAGRCNVRNIVIVYNALCLFFASLKLVQVSRLCPCFSFVRLANKPLRPLRLPFAFFAPARLFGGVILFLFPLTALAQTTPVQANLQITAPYPVSLGQYASPINDKLNLTLLFKDQSVGMVDVLFRLSIEGPGGIKIQTNPSFRGVPVTLQALLPTQLTGYDLAPYFALENLIFSGGLTKTEYQRTGALPEGFYNFKLQVVHARRTEVVISNTALAPTWLTYSDPPFINLPICGTQLELAEPQYIQFQWMPMHLASPLAINTEYLLELVEIRPKERNPNDAMQSTRPIFETTTTSPTYFYGPADPPLIPGMHYAFRVKVLDPDGNLFFKNQGYSVVCNFTYGQENNLLPPDDIAVNLEREKVVRVTWEPRLEASSYKVAYKFADETDLSSVASAQEESPWHYIETAGSSAIINDLAYDKAYNFKVQSLFGPYASEWGTPQMATTQPPKEFVCNTETFPPVPTNLTPLQFLWPYDKVQVGNFEMEVLKVKGSNGLYSGIGSIYNPQWFITFKVIFENIAINEIYEMTAGKVHVETQGAQAYIDSFEDDLDNGDSIPTNEDPINTDTGIDIPQDTITVDGVIDSVYVDATTGAIVVVTEDGEEITIDEEDLEGDGSVLLTDSEGNSWTVDGEGNVTEGNEGNLSDVVADGSKKDNGYYITIPNDTTKYKNGDGLVFIKQRGNLQLTLNKEKGNIKTDKLLWVIEKDEKCGGKVECETNLNKKGNKNITAYLKNGKKREKLLGVELTVYKNPSIIFEKEKNVSYNGEFGFDNAGFEPLKKQTDFERINMNGAYYWVPLLTMRESETWSIGITANFNGERSNMKKDRKFKVTFRPSTNDLELNYGQQEVTYTFDQIKNGANLYIEAKSSTGTLDFKRTEYIIATNQKGNIVGKMAVVVGGQDNMTEKNVIFIKVKHKTNFPSYPESTYLYKLNNKSYNQALIKWVKSSTLELDISNYYKKNKSKFDSPRKTREKIKKIFQDSTGVNVINSGDYYVFITDIATINEDGDPVGGQANGIPGTYLCLFKDRQNSTIIHELGHVLNLEHTFPMTDKNGNTIIKNDSSHDIPQLSTENFMDYSSKRNMFFLYQLKRITR